MESPERERERKTERESEIGGGGRRDREKGKREANMGEINPISLLLLWEPQVIFDFIIASL